ncbi:hypothetical protein [Sphingobium sp. CFD-2]|uniref:hypothetical protein n=1 Tax=Sphingobium sp. CFD-2 TaxID=2878542 RepID=UPI0035A35212
MMRIVFPAHVDEMGRLHEASAIHAVVAPGEWRATASGPSPVRNALAAAPQMIERVETAGTHGDVPTATDPDLPDPGAVAAARMRAADPLARIKADVQQRLRVSSSPARSRPSALRKDGAPALQASAGEASIPGQEKAASPNLVEQRSAIGQASLEEPKAASPAPADAGLFPAFAREGE